MLDVLATICDLLVSLIMLTMRGSRGDIGSKPPSIRFYRNLQLGPHSKKLTPTWKNPIPWILGKL